MLRPHPRPHPAGVLWVGPRGAACGYSSALMPCSDWLGGVSGASYSCRMSQAWAPWEVTPEHTDTHAPLLLGCHDPLHRSALQPKHTSKLLCSSPTWAGAFLSGSL